MKILKWLDKNLERVLLMFFLSAISCLLMFQIIMRYCFSSALPWAEELARYGFVVSAYLCMAYCIKEDLLFRIDTVINALPKMIQKILDSLMWGVSFIFFIYCTIKSLEVTLIAYDSGTVSPALAVPIYILFAFGTFGFLLTSIRILQRIVKMFKEYTQVEKVSMKNDNEKFDEVLHASVE